MKLLSALLLLPFVDRVVCNGEVNGVDRENLPAEAVFPGVWDKYIQAPSNKTFIRPRGIKLIEGDVGGSYESLLVIRQDNGKEVLRVADEAADRKGGDDGRQMPIHGPRRGVMTMGRGGLVVFDFEENIAGRYALRLSYSSPLPVLHRPYLPSPAWA